jgi:hypothetical protein
MIRKLHNIAIAPSIAVLLTIILWAFSLSGIVEWPWWVIASPALAVAAFYFALLVIFLIVISGLSLLALIFKRNARFTIDRKAKACCPEE